jgi:hypothetical protein
VSAAIDQEMMMKAIDEANEKKREDDAWILWQW